MKKVILLSVSLVLLVITSSFGQLTLPGSQAMKATSDAAYVLSWEVAPTASTPEFREEHYSVWISTTGNEPGDFTTMLFEETLSTEHTNWEFQTREVSLNSYAGQIIHVAFRHHDVTDKDRIVIDNVKIFMGDGGATKEDVVFLFEDFEGYADHDDFVANSGWTLIDADGDEHNWYLHYDSFDENFVMASRSWISGTGPLTPDNWMITPAVELESAGDADYFLSWDVAPTASTPEFREEHYSVWISTTGNEPGDFTTMLFEETLSTEHTNWEFQTREVNLNNYVGPTVHVAFRHHDVTDKDRIVIDNVKIYKTDAGETTEETIFLFEDFEGYDDHDDFVANSGWILIDADGDGHNWYLHYDSFDENFVMASRSWLSETGPLTPNNWLITPLVSLFPVSVPEKEIVKAEIVIFPNPASSYVTVRSDAGIEEVELFNLIGSQVMKLRPANNELSLDVSLLKPGLYFVRLHTGQGTVTQKINISR
jgi:hypothetical protein